MTSARGLIAVSDTLIACVVGCIAAWHSPWLKLDTAIGFSALAFVSPVFWAGHCSRSFVMRSGVTAYFFRCVALYAMGSDAVRIIAFGDAAMGLAAVGGACIIRWSISRYIGQGGRTVFRQSLREGGSASGYCSGGEEEREIAATATNGSRKDASVSPLQFSLRALFVLTFASAALLAVAATGGPRVALVVLLLGLFWLLLAGCVRLVRLGGSEEPPAKPEASIVNRSKR